VQSDAGLELKLNEVLKMVVLHAGRGNPGQPSRFWFFGQFFTSLVVISYCWRVDLLGCSFTTYP
jgi:hypothetical protein